jgi:hypothetical protein
MAGWCWPKTASWRGFAAWRVGGLAVENQIPFGNDRKKSKSKSKNKGKSKGENKGTSFAAPWTRGASQPCPQKGRAQPMAAPFKVNEGGSGGSIFPAGFPDI